MLDEADAEWEKRYYVDPDADEDGDASGWEIWIKGRSDNGACIASVTSEERAEIILAAKAALERERGVYA